MHKKNFLSFVFLFAGTLLLQPLWSQSDISQKLIEYSLAGGKISQQRLEQVHQLVSDAYANQRGELFTSTNRQALIQQVERSVGWKGKAVLWSEEMCEKEARRLLYQKAEEKYPELSLDELKAEAEKRFPLYKIGDDITVVFQNNPISPTKKRGIYRGTIQRRVRLGSYLILLEDMKRIEGNEKEIQKLDPELTRKLRDDFVETMQKSRKAEYIQFVENNLNPYREKCYQDAVKANEAAGFIYKNGRWRAVRFFVEAELAACQENFLQREQREMQKKLFLQQKRLTAPIEAITYHRMVYPENERPNPTLFLKEQEEARRRQDAEFLRLQREEAEAAEREKSARQQKELKKRQEEFQLKRAKALSDQSVDIELNQEFSLFSGAYLALYFVGGLAIIGLIVSNILSYRKRREKDRFIRFFEGKGEAQKKFWDAAAANPDDFKYVTYFFPNVKQAVEALGLLSYMKISHTGELYCQHDELMYGVYKHHGGAVAYVGGLKMKYALWREASALLPEQPGARFFKVSTEPPVTGLALPSEELLHSLSVEALGFHELMMPVVGYQRIYLYQCENAEAAQQLLSQFHISSNDVMAQVTVVNDNGHAFFSLTMDQGIQEGAVLPDNFEEYEIHKKEAAAQ